ncbi:MAG: hypothetical protein K6T17_00280 [Fimbriimonadales bacterium]|nr:hypothetical protein [Fimbriimonadales bacterium]
MGVMVLMGLWGCGSEPSPRRDLAEEDVPTPLPREEVPPEGVLLRLRLGVGDELVYEYRVRETLTEYAPLGKKAGEATVKAKAKLLYRCVATQAGKFEIEQEFDSPKFEITGEGSFKGREKSLREAYASAWRVPRYLLWTARYGVDDRPPIFPEGRVRAGDEWTVTMPGKKGQGVLMGEGVYRYRVEGFERVRGFRTVKVRVEAPSTPLQRSKGPAFVWYDLETGVVVRVRLAVEVQIPSHQVREEEQDLIEIRRGGGSVRVLG